MKNLDIRWKQLLIALGLALLVLLIKDFNNRMAELRRLTNEKEHVSAEVTSLVSTKASLETQIALSQSGDAAEASLREDAKLIRPGDIPIIVMPGAENEPQPTPIPLITPQAVDRWQLWLALFLDPKAP